MIEIVLLNWNRIESTVACLKRLTQWTKIQPRIWVVDNASQDESVTIISHDFPTVQLIVSEVNLGFAGGNNLAMRQILSHGTDNPILLLNNDAFIDEKNTLRLLEALQMWPEIAVVGPLFCHKDEIISAGGRDIAWHINTHLLYPNGYKPHQLNPNMIKSGEPYSVDYVSGTVALLRASALTKVGLFDESYFFSGEMADLCERFKQHGYNCAITPRAVASHDTEQASSFRHTLYAYYILRNRFLFIRKFRPNQVVPLFIFWIFYGLASIAKAIWHGEWLSVKATFFAINDGLKGDFGNKNFRFGNLFAHHARCGFAIRNGYLANL